MKKIIVGILIGIALSLGTLSFAQSQIKLIMVPEYIAGYSTIDLLNYVAQMKAKEDKPKIVIPPQYTPKPIPQIPQPNNRPQKNYPGNAQA